MRTAHSNCKEHPSLRRFLGSTILPPHLQRSRSPAPRRQPDLQPTNARRRIEGKGVLHLACSKRKAWIAGAAISVLFFVGVAWQPVSRAIWLAHLELSFGPAEELSPLPINLSLANAGVSQPTSLPAEQIFTALPEADLQEPTLAAFPIRESEDLVPDQPPIPSSFVEVMNRHAVAPSIAEPPDELRPIAKIHNLRVRKTAQVPVDTGKDRTLSNFGRGATVIASYYGKEFAGRRTASGEKFNPSKMTAAHRTLPLGTQVQVTHVRNGRSVMVRINDRGPFIKGRSIDLSAGAAAVIELGGVGRVHLKIVR